MNKRRLSIILAIFFLVQSIPFPQELSAETYVLSPQTKVSLNETNLSSNIIYAIVYSAVVIYTLDAIKGCPKADIMRRCGDAIANLLGVRFDLENIDIRKKGWTRYYPFSVHGRNFIIRIFLTEELAYQPKLEVLYEGTIENPHITFQILDGVNAILKGCRTEPHNSYRQVSQADTSP